MNRAEIIETFKRLKREYTPLSSAVMSIIQEDLKLVTTELSAPSGGYAWRIDNRNQRATIQIYYDGMTIIYLQSKLTPAEKKSWNTTGDYANLEDCHFEVVYLVRETGLDELITKLREHLFKE